MIDAEYAVKVLRGEYEDALWQMKTARFNGGVCNNIYYEGYCDGINRALSIVLKLGGIPMSANDVISTIDHEAIIESPIISR